MAGLPTAQIAILAIALGGCQVVFPLEEGRGECPATYETLDIAGHTGFYRFVFEPDDRKAWVFAEADCKKDGPTAHLAVLGSVASPTAEANVVFQRAIDLENPSSPADVFVGLSARTGAYKWVTDEPIAVPPEATPPWGPNDPSPPDNLLCAEIDIQTGQFVTTGCGGADAYVCECDDFPEQPASF